ncbi:MAG: hypothetical protein GY859_12800, partial [Desulfobacterales bacterium]|nr:hypothetical protein [Desulfobacterales bacterium]
WIQKKTDAFLFAILFTVFALRFILLPFSVKTEVDRLKEAKRAPQIAQLKKKLKDHPQRLSRAIQGISREDRMTPIFNMVGNIAQMILFIVLFTVVGDAAQKFGGDALWMKPVSKPDPVYIMPLLVAGIIFLHMYLSNPKASRAKMALYIGSAAAIFLITFQISAALNIYLFMSIGLLLIHGVIVRKVYGARTRKTKSPEVARQLDIKEYKGIVPLRYVTEASGGGNKALKLAELMAGGFPVPDGFVVSHDVLRQEALTAGDRKKIDDFWKRINPEKVAVRSSGLKEDGAEMSYAGIFESVLDVTRENFYDALDEVKESLSSSRAEAYSGAQAEAGGIVVQEMVRAEYAGVMFTEHPGSSGSMMIELVEGLGETLVSGQATPESYQFGKYSGSPMFKGDPPFDLAPLLKMGKEVERHFNGPQDIEWAFAKNRFHLLQTRDITSDSRRSGGQKGKFERERYRVLNVVKHQKPEDVVLRQNELSELLPRPTRLSLNIMQRLWEPGGTVDLACGALGIPYLVEEDSPSYVDTAFGSLYVNCFEEKKRTSKGVNT